LKKKKKKKNDFLCLSRWEVTLTELNAAQNLPLNKSFVCTG